MAVEQTSTITENLDLFRRLAQEYPRPLNVEIAKRMKTSKQRISNFARFWFAVDCGMLDPQLIRVIREHNNVEGVRPGEDRDWFTFDKVSGQKGLHLTLSRYYPEHAVRFSVKEQVSALKETFEAAKRLGRMRAEVETIEDCSDE